MPAAADPELRPSLTVYTNAVMALGAVLLVVFAPRAVAAQPVWFALLLAAAVASSTLKVSLALSGGGATMTIANAVGFAGLLIVGPHATAAFVSVSVWTQCTYRPARKTPIDLRRRLFSVACGAITAEAAGWVLIALGGGPGRLEPAQLAAPLAACALVYFLANSVLVAGAIALSTRDSLVAVWYRNFLWSAPGYFVSAAAVGLAAFAIHHGAYLLVTISIVVLGVTFLGYRVYLGRLVEEQHRLQVATDYTQGIIHSMSEMLLVTSPDGLIATANAATCETLGYTAEELVGRPLSDVLVARADGGLETTPGDEPARNVEREFRTKSGERIPVLFSTSPLTGSGKGTRDTVSVALDIRQRRMAEARTRQKEERLRLHESALSDLAREKALHVGDFDAAARLLTETAGRILGAVETGIWLERDGELECLDAFDLGADTHGSMGALPLDSASGVKAALQTRRVVPVEGGHGVEGWPLGGRSRRGSALVAPIRLGAKMVGVVSMAREYRPDGWSIEEQQFAGSVADLASLALEARNRRRATEELQKAKEAAEAASIAKSAFLATMSHELRTPLNAIIGYAELVLEDAAVSGALSQVSDVLKIERAGKHLLSVINDILDFSKIEAGMMDLHRETFDVAALVDDVVLTMEPLGTKNRNCLVVEAGPALGSVTADATRVRQVLLNLLGNACKFTEQGTVTVRCSRSTENGRELIVIGVSDTGIGMSESQVAGLFREFHQGDSGTTRRFDGTGLGLAITKRLTELMGGTISVESALGVGSTFTVRLPVTAANAPNADRPSQPAA